MAARDHLLERYNLWEAAEHDAGLVVVSLDSNGRKLQDA